MRPLRPVRDYPDPVRLTVLALLMKVCSQRTQAVATGIHSGKSPSSQSLSWFAWDLSVSWRKSAQPCTEPESQDTAGLAKAND